MGDILCSESRSSRMMTPAKHQVASICILMSLFFVNAFSQSCRSGWYYHEGSCYGVGGQQVQWSEAQEFCEMYNGNLAEITSKSENDFIITLTKKVPDHDHVWIGGTDIFSEGNWEWIGTKNSIDEYNNWAPGQPDHQGNSEGEDCLVFRGDSQGVWHDFE